MQGHLLVDPNHPPALASDPETDFIILGGDDLGVITPDLVDRLHTHHGVTAACFGLSSRAVPLEIGEIVIDRTSRKTLPPSSTNDSDIVVFFEHFACTLEPTLNHLAIAVDELDESYCRIDLAKSFEALVSGSSCRKRAG
jgi:hypothetical protein